MRQAHSQKLHLILWMEFHLRNQKAGSENSDTLPNTLELVALTPVWFRASVLQRIQEPPICFQQGVGANSAPFQSLFTHLELCYATPSVPAEQQVSVACSMDHPMTGALCG
jgi:hypothetical protein